MSRCPHRAPPMAMAPTPRPGEPWAHPRSCRSWCSPASLALGAGVTSADADRRPCCGIEHGTTPARRDGPGHRDRPGRAWRWPGSSSGGAARRSSASSPGARPDPAALRRNRWYVDAIYRATVVGLLSGVSASRASASRQTRGLDGAADERRPRAPSRAGQRRRRSQTGRLQLYIGTAVLVVVAAFYLMR